MKKVKNIIVLFFNIIAFTSCINDNEFEVPTIESEENATLNKILEDISNGDKELKTIQQIKDAYIANREPLPILSEIVIKGYVISSDREGNFYKEIYLQDAPENPTTGIKIILNATNSYNTYNLGRETYVYLKGLYIGETNAGDDIITIGGKLKADNPTEIDVINTNQIEHYIFRSQVTNTITPKIVLSNAITKKDIGTFISIQNCAFEENLAGESYVDPTEDFDTNRELLVCQGLGYFSIPVETSSFSLFANESLPSGGGTVNAVLTKNYAGDTFVLALNTTDDVLLNETKCTPIDQTDFTTLLEEYFEGTSGDIFIENWTNYKESGTRLWKSYDDENTLNKAATIGSFFSRNDSTVGWLITKGINLDNTTQEFLSFETSNSFSDSSELEVLISTDWNGTEENISTATWQNLPAKIIDDAATHEVWVHSGFINLSAYNGTAYIAFKYTGSGDENFDGSFELDNIKIQAK